jgi:hypothetical protein
MNPIVFTVIGKLKNHDRSQVSRLSIQEMENGSLHQFGALEFG